MKKMILAAAAAALAFGVQAEFKKNPDANTLWSESGANAFTKNWSIGKGFKAGPDATRFDVVAENGVWAGSSFGHYTAINKDYPWLVVKVVKATPGKGYYSLGVYWLKGPKGIGMGVNKINPGVYVNKVVCPEKPQDGYLRIDFYGKELTLDYLGMQKVPEVAPEFTNKTLKKGEDLVLTVTLQKPADGIQVKFFKSYTMPQIKLNGKKSMELTGSADKKVWTLKVPYEQFDGFTAGKKIDTNAIIFELDITRGDNSEKYYTNNTFEILP